MYTTFEEFAFQAQKLKKQLEQASNNTRDPGLYCLTIPRGTALSALCSCCTYVLPSYLKDSFYRANTLLENIDGKYKGALASSNTEQNLRLFGGYILRQTVESFKDKFLDREYYRITSSYAQQCTGIISEILELHKNFLTFINTTPATYTPDNTLESKESSKTDKESKMIKKLYQEIKALTGRLLAAEQLAKDKAYSAKVSKDKIKILEEQISVQAEKLSLLSDLQSQYKELMTSHSYLKKKLNQFYTSEVPRDL